MCYYGSSIWWKIFLLRINRLVPIANPFANPRSENPCTIRKSLVRTWSCNMTYKSSQHRWKSLYKNQYRFDFQSCTIDSPFYQSFNNFSTFNIISMADDCIIWIRCSVSCDQHDFEFKVIFIWRFHNAQIFKIKFTIEGLINQIYLNRSVKFKFLRKLCFRWLKWSRFIFLVFNEEIKAISAS